jgi:hypothetical protein
MSLSVAGGPATIKAVVAYAARLRAEKERVTNPDLPGYDPYANPYALSDDAAKKLVTRKRAELLEPFGRNPTEKQLEEASRRAPEKALFEINWRVARRERERTEGDKQRDRSDAKLAKVHHKARERRESTGLTMGQRIDAAIATLACAGNGQTSTLDPNKVTTGERDDMNGTNPNTGTPAFPGTPVAEAVAIARKAAREIEALYDDYRRSPRVEQAA